MHCKWSPLQGISHLLDKIFYPLRLCWLIFIIYFFFSSLWNNLNSLYFYRYIGQTSRPGGRLPDAWRELRNTGYSRFSCHKSWICVFSVELQSSPLLPPRPNPLWMAAVVVRCAFAGECWGVQELGTLLQIFLKKASAKQSSPWPTLCYSGLSWVYIISLWSTLVIKAFLK